MANPESGRSKGPEPTAWPQSEVGRRTFLKGAGALGAAAFAAPLVSKDWSFVRAAVPGTPTTPIEHVVISCQENRSFDRYFGFASWIGSYGVPAGYSQPDRLGGPWSRIASPNWRRRTFPTRGGRSTRGPSGTGRR